MKPKPSSKPKTDLSVTCCVINEFDIFREGLVSVIKNIPVLHDVIGCSREEYLQLENSSGIDLIVSEIEFNGKLDIEFVKTVRKLNPDSTIIIYTHIKNNEFRNYTIHCGADFFVFIEERFNLLEHLISGIGKNRTSSRKQYRNS